VIFDPAVTGSGLSLFVTARSGPATVVVAEELLLAGLASADAEPPVAVLVIADPAPAFAATTIENVDVAPAANVAILQEIVPVPPTAGVEHANAGPLLCVSDRNVVPVGTASVSVTVCASLVPMFEIDTVYVMMPPSPTDAGPLLVTEMSEVTATVVLAVALLFERFGSVSVVLTLAVFEITVPFAVVGLTLTTT